MHHTPRVITWQTPSGDKINVCTACKKARVRIPKTKTGEEYCQVYRGIHRGRCSFAAEQDGK